MNDKNIYQRMAEITKSIKSVEKNLNVDMGNNKTYKAVSEADVLREVRMKEVENGVYSYPSSRKVIDQQVMVTNGKYGEKTNLFLRVEVIYRFVNIDKPEEYVEVVSYGDGVDSQDKAPGKAMTYADKYALLKAYKIPTGDDPDQEASEELKQVTPEIMASKEQIDLIKAAYKGKEEKIESFLNKYEVDSMAKMTYKFASDWISLINKNKPKQEEPKQPSLDEI